LETDERFQDLVRIYQESSDFLKKLNASDEGIKMDLITYLFNLGCYLLRTKNTEKAIATYQEADKLLSLLPDSKEFASARNKIKQGLETVKSSNYSQISFTKAG
jgi:tetratricopeptide (TPR) repeat protein